LQVDRTNIINDINGLRIVDDSVERRPQFVRHFAKKLRLHAISLLRLATVRLGLRPANLSLTTTALRLHGPCRLHLPDLCGGGGDRVPDLPAPLKEKDARPLDSKGLAAMADTFMPRVFFITDKPKLGYTVSLALSILVSDAELAQAGRDFLFLEGDSDCVRAGAYDQRGRLWSRSGRLLATTNQIAFFR